MLTLRNLLPKPACGAQMIDLGLPQIIQSLKAQAWSDEVTLLILLLKLNKGSSMHKDSANANSGEGLDHIRSFICSLILHCKTLFRD